MFNATIRTSNVDPPRMQRAVTPSDTTDLTLNGYPCRGLYVGGAGDVAILLADDTLAVTRKSVPAGSVVTGIIKKVMATNTTATSIVALY